MPNQSAFRLVKRWKRYETRDNATASVPSKTRGLYALYKKEGKKYRVMYIGVAGLGKGGTGGIRGRLRSHRSKKKDWTKKDWTHFSMFEVHDNITREEIMELEAVLLAIFRYDPRPLTNRQKGSRKLSLLRRKLLWKER